MSVLHIKHVGTLLGALEHPEFTSMQQFEELALAPQDNTDASWSASTALGYNILWATVWSHQFS